MSVEEAKQRVLPLEKSFPNSTVARLKRGELTVPQIVLDKTMFNPIRRNTKLLTDYIVEHREDFIDILLNSEDPDLQSSSLRILRCGNRRIVQAVASSQTILRFGENLNESSNLNRFPLIMEICLSDYPDLISETFSFLPMMSRFATRSSVICLFEKILQPLDILAPIHYFLKMSGFPNYIATEAYKTEDEEQKLALFRILLFCLANPILEMCSTGSSSMDLLMQCSEHTNTHISNLAWKFALMAVVLGDNDDTFASLLLDKATNAISLVSHTEFLEYQVTALLFLSKLINIRPMTSSVANIDMIFDCLVEIYHSFPGHSIALSAVFEFIYVSLDNSYIRAKVIRKLCPVIINSLSNSKNRTLLSFSTKFLCDLRRVAKHDSILNEELTGEIKQSFDSYCDPFEEVVHPRREKRNCEDIDEILDGIDISAARTGHFVSSQDF